MTIQYPWPSPPGYTERPVWTGGGFQLGQALLPILSYEAGISGWTGQLTTFHEETAGADHFIDRASREHALAQICRHVNGAAGTILEVGCSSGFMLRLLREHLPHAVIIGSDVVRGPLDQLAASMPDVPLLEFDLVKCPLPSDSIDAVVLLNVLEHINDDVSALRQVYRILKPGGIVVIEVPSGPHLYDIYDKMLLHWRRYSIAGLYSIVKKAGFQVIEKSHLACFLYPGFWFIKRRNRKFLAEPESTQKTIVAKNIRASSSALFHTIMRIELAIGRYISYPFGIRCLLTGIKKSQ
jgi:ubiquinone/menaquinone biosynthesis C-methylase UbiE